MGSPSPFHESGSVIAGLPVQLKIGVKGMNSISRSKKSFGIIVGEEVAVRRRRGAERRRQPDVVRLVEAREVPRRRVDIGDPCNTSLSAQLAPFLDQMEVVGLCVLA